MLCKEYKLALNHYCCYLSGSLTSIALFLQYGYTTVFAQNTIILSLFLSLFFYFSLTTCKRQYNQRTPVSCDNTVRFDWFSPVHENTAWWRCCRGKVRNNPGNIFGCNVHAVGISWSPTSWRDSDNLNIRIRFEISGKCVLCIAEYFQVSVFTDQNKLIFASKRTCIQHLSLWIHF